MSTVDPTSRPRWSTGRKLGLQLALVPLVLVGVELGYRGLLAARGQGYDAAETLADVRRVVTNLTDPVPRPEQEGEGQEDAELKRESIHPYLGFDALANADVFAQQAAYAAQPAADETFDLLIVGGSVSARFHDHGGAELVRLLAQDPRLADRPIRLLRHGRGSFKQPQQLFVLTWLLALGVEPDAVVNLDGFNEVALGNENGGRGTHPLYPSLPRWGHLAQGTFGDWDVVDALHAIRRLRERAQRTARAVERLGLHRSAVLGRVARRRMVGYQAATVDAYQAYLTAVEADADGLVLRGPSFAPGTGPQVEVAVRAWTEASRALDAICRDRGIPYLHVLQPTLHDEGSKPLTDEERANATAVDAWIEGVHAGYPLLRAGLAELAADGVHVLDASGVFADDDRTLYFDACHFEPPGHVTLARAVAAAFLDALPAEGLPR